jgi:hypothetical protein
MQSGNQVSTQLPITVMAQQVVQPRPTEALQRVALTQFQRTVLENFPKQVLPLQAGVLPQMVEGIHMQMLQQL